MRFVERFGALGVVGEWVLGVEVSIPCEERGIVAVSVMLYTTAWKLNLIVFNFAFFQTTRRENQPCAC